MKIKNKVFKYYLIFLIVFLCVFALGFGTISAQNNTKKSTKGISQTIITDENVLKYWHYFKI
ncbi:MAG: hypothetical protein RRZ68_02310 [Oscillospiraceae bacterium]